MGDHYYSLWIAIKKDGKYWPKSFVSPKDRQFSVQFDENDAFFISLLAVSAEGDQEIRSWLNTGEAKKKNGETENLWPGFPKVPGSNVLHEVFVTSPPA